jgi:ketosteroid isomerase-like protein
MRSGVGDSHSVADENVRLIYEVSRIWNADPSSPPIDYLDPEIEWETRWPGLPRYFHGHEGVKEWVDRVLEPMQIEMKLIRAESVDDERVLAEYHAQGEGRGSGARTEMEIFDVYWICDGKIYRRRTFYSEAEALEAEGQEQ